MCGRLACSLSQNELTKCCAYQRTDSKSLEEPEWVQNSSYSFTPLYNISPSGTVAVLANKNHFNTEINSEYTLVPMRWGMIPLWSVDERKSQFHTHNARIETIMQSKIYKNEFLQGRRCVVVCEGYFEWQTTQKTSVHQPYFFYNETVTKESEQVNDDLKPLVYLAGIFNAFKDKFLSKIRYTCSVITKDADESVSWCHHRMPIALQSFNDIQQWIESSDNDPNEILNYLKNYKSRDKNIVLRYHAVDKQYVNNSKCNDKKCLERLSVKRKSSTLEHWIKKKSNDK